MLAFINVPGFWLAVLQIILIDIVLSGDNAVVIALACRNLPVAQRRLGILWGVAGAVVLRLILTFFAVGLLGFPWLKLFGSLLLLWIGVQLLVPDDADDSKIKPANHLLGAIRTIIVADFVMSLDNVVGVAAAAKDNVYLLFFGLIVSIPLIVWSSQVILKLMERFSIIVVLGAGLLGWVAGEMMFSEPVLKDWMSTQWPSAHTLLPALGALVVVLMGKWLERRALASRDIRLV
jgi:YjbE family integral membrane protein